MHTLLLAPILGPTVQMATNSQHIAGTTFDRSTKQMQNNASNWFDTLIQRLKTNSRFIQSFGMGAGEGEGKNIADTNESTALRAHAQEGDNQPRFARTSINTIKLASLARTSDTHGLLILFIAGGPDWGDGRPASPSLGVAAREARRLADTLGQAPSHTSIDEAAGAAAHAIACGLSDPVLGRYLRRVKLTADWEQLPHDVWQWPGFRRWARRTGARAAFKILRRQNNGGTTGEHADANAHIFSIESVTAEIAAQDCCQAVRNEAGACELEQDHRARLSAVSDWIWASLVNALPEGRGAGAAQAQRTARQRARFLIRLTWGATLPDAAKLAGYASANAALESLRSGKIMDQLKTAAGRNWSKLPGFIELRARARVAGMRAGKSVRAFREVAAMNTKARLARSIVSKAIAEREAAVDSAKFAVARMADAIARQNQAWERAPKGWRKGWLQCDKA